MIKNVTIYGNINDYVAAEFVNQIDRAENFGDDIKVRISSNGGDVMAGFSMLARLQEFKGKKSIVVDGKAYSMGAFMCLYADEVEAYDVAEFLLHRAAYPEWYEKNYATEDDMKRLANTNKVLMAKMKSKFDSETFEKLAGMTIDEMFDGEQKDVILTAKDAKKLGIISKILKLDSVAKTEINANCQSVGIQAMYDNELNEIGGDENVNQKANEPNFNNNKNNKKMTVDELKQNHPEVANAFRDEIHAEVRDNIAAWGEWKDVDANMAFEGVKTLKAPTSAELSKLTKLAIKQGDSLEKIEEETPVPAGAETPETGATDKGGEAEISAREKMLNFLNQ